MFWPFMPLYMAWDFLYEEVLKPVGFVFLAVALPIGISGCAVWIIGSLIRRWI